MRAPFLAEEVHLLVCWVKSITRLRVVCQGLEPRARVHCQETIQSFLLSRPFPSVWHTSGQTEHLHWQKKMQDDDTSWWCLCCGRGLLHIKKSVSSLWFGHSQKVPLVHSESWWLMRRSPLRPLEPCSGCLLRRNRAKAVFSTLASRVVFWSRHCVPYRPSHISSSVCIPDPSYLSLFKVHVIYAQLAQVREGFCSLWPFWGPWRGLHQSLEPLPCCRWEPVQLCPFLCDSTGQSAFALRVDWAVCSPNHYPAACSKFLLLASLIQCPQGMSDSLRGWN